MKLHHFFHPATLLVALAFLLQGAAFAEPVAVTVLKTDDTRLVGFIGETNDKGIKFLYTPGDRTGLGLPHAQVKAVSFTDEGDIMGPARHAYSRSQFVEAEQLFRAVADEYDFLWGISRAQFGNFASEARFYQIDCLRRIGRYSDMGAAIDTNTGKSLSNTITEALLPKLELFSLWGNYANEKWDELEAGLKAFETEPDERAAELLTTPGFKPAPPSETVQLAFMRGKLFASKEGRTEDALRDFYLTMTLDYGSDRVLTKLAMESALRLQAAEEGLDKSHHMKKEIHALAVIYSRGFNEGNAETWYNDFLKPVPDPKPKAGAAPPAEEPAADPAEPAAADAPEPAAADAPDPAAPDAPAPDAAADAGTN
ncbi:MAG: hypothetical protein ACI8UO_000728 [Verrucomicrobiales bacterium]|jgi:hypothetical protein